MRRKQSLGFWGTLAQDGTSCAPGVRQRSLILWVKERERERDYESLKLLNGKLVLTVSLLVAVYFKYIILNLSRCKVKSSRVCNHHEWTGGFPDVHRFIVGDCDMGREGSGLHRQSDKGQHQERR